MHRPPRPVLADRRQQHLTSHAKSRRGKLSSPAWRTGARPHCPQPHTACLRLGQRQRSEVSCPSSSTQIRPHRPCLPGQTQVSRAASPSRTACSSRSWKGWRRPHNFLPSCVSAASVRSLTSCACGSDNTNEMASSASAKALLRAHPQAEGAGRGVDRRTRHRPVGSWRPRPAPALRFKRAGAWHTLSYRQLNKAADAFALTACAVLAGAPVGSERSGSRWSGGPWPLAEALRAPVTVTRRWGGCQSRPPSPSNFRPARRTACVGARCARSPRSDDATGRKRNSDPSLGPKVRPEDDGRGAGEPNG